MKRAELKVRNEISGYILLKAECDREWKGYLGEIWIETERIAENTIINCYYSGIHYGRLRISEGLIIQFKVAPVGRGLLQLRWFLEQIKKR
jgi:hypothetical protein